MPTDIADSVGFSSDLSTRADRLSAYLRDRFPQATPLVSMMAAFGLASGPEADLKQVAKQLSASLQPHGIKLKHSYALEAASQMIFGRPWLTLRKTSKPLLIVKPGETTQPEQLEFSDWHEAATPLAELCDSWMASHPGVSWFRINFEAEFVTLLASDPSTPHDLAPYPIPVLMIYPFEDYREFGWMKDMFPTIEFLRRHLEESRVAVLEHDAVVNACNRPASPSAHPQSPLVIEDLPHTQLFVRMEDGKGNGYEIARGGELNCWDSIRNFSPTGSPRFTLNNDGHWEHDQYQLAWYVESLRSAFGREYGLTAKLSFQESQRLLRRFGLAIGMFDRQQFRPGRYAPSSSFLSAEEPGSYDIDGGALFAAFRMANKSWAAFCSETNCTLPPDSNMLPKNVAKNLAAWLQLDDPGSFLAGPPEKELVDGTPNAFGRLSSGVTHARYRLTDHLSLETRAAVEVLFRDFIREAIPDPASRKQRLSGVELNEYLASFVGAIESLGLKMRIGPMHNLQWEPINPDDVFHGLSHGHSLMVAIRSAQKA